MGLICYRKMPKEFSAIIITTSLVLIGIWIIGRSLPKEDFAKNMILAAGFGLTAISWFVSGYINNQQSVLQKKRKLKVRMLTDAFFKLQNIYSREGNETQVNAYIYYKYSENALNEIQLIGDPKLVKLASVFGLSNGARGYEDLLVELRNDLRKELGVSSIPNDEDLKPFSFRANRKLITQDTLTSEEEINLIMKLNEEHKDLFK